MPTSVSDLNKSFAFNDNKIKIVDPPATKLVGTKEEVKWQCLRCNREFRRKLEYVKGDVKKGVPPCSDCSNHFYFNEELCRHILNQLLDKSFEKIRPDWLREDPQSPPLELDGFCESENLAFEYQGEQHYFPIKDRFTEDDVSKIQKRDAFKLKKCEERGITLLVVEPENVAKRTPQEQIESLLKEKKIETRSAKVDFKDFLKGQSKTSEQRAVIHALNKGYKLEKPDPLTLNDEDFKFFCSIEGHDTPIQAKEINLSTGRPTCTDCGHAETARKNRKPSLSADEISEALLKCEPSLTLEKWAGQNQKGEHLCKCSDEECAFVGSYAEREIIGGAGKNICWGCKPKSKKRVQMAEVLAKVSALGGKCLSYNSAMEPISRKTELTFHCFNSSHDEFSLTVGQILDDQWCTTSPCDERKLKKAIVGSKEIQERISQYFKGVKFREEPGHGQNSPLAISCVYCDHGLKNLYGKQHTFKSLKTVTALKCGRCGENLGKGWQQKMNP